MKAIIRLTCAAAALATLAACEDAAAPSVGTPYEGGIPFGTYTVVGFGKEAVPTRDGRITLRSGTLSGNGPCNGFTAVNAATLPAIRITSMNWTDEVCRHKGFEDRFFQALTQAQSAQWQGGVLKIIGPTYITLERTGD